MKKSVLIIDDDPAIRQVLEDRMDSAGFDHDSADSQVAAVECLQKHRYDLILLDLELPSRKGKPTSTQVGRNLLEQIREDDHNETTPVIVITAHGGDKPDTAVTLMAAGANYFIHKPSLHQLEDTVKLVLNPKPKGKKAVGSSKPAELKAYAGGELELKEIGVLLDGIQLASQSATIFRVLEVLSEETERGRRRACSSQILADQLKLRRGQNAVIEAISDFRSKVVQELKKAGVKADDDAVIVTGRSGYELAGWIRAAKKIGVAPNQSVEITPVQRQAWFLEQLQKGRKLTRADFEAHYDIHSSTSKRDLKALEDRIEFTGVGRKGCYRVKKKNAKT